MKRTPYLLLVLALPILFFGGIALGGHPDLLPSPVREAFVGDSDAQIVEEALDDIAADYYRPVKRADLVNKAIGGAVDSLDDRFSNYFSPAQFRQFQAATDASFSGVGMEVREDPRGLKVVRVYDDSPAKRAKIAADDRIIGVNGRTLKGKPQEASTALIRGKPGSDVRLEILTPGKRARMQTVTRATVSVPVVASKLRRAEDGTKVAHVALATFSSGAHGELRGAIDKRLKEGAKGIVLDLRRNGGGLLEEARLVSSIFIKEGEIVSTRGRNQPKRTLDATGGAIDEDIPLVVLVDRDTASASEIVAGAVKDRGRGKVVGLPTFGKGVFQQVKPLGNGGALDITVGQYFTPNGTNLGGGGVKRGAGVKPNVRAADRPKTKADEGFDRALEVLAAEL